MPRLLPRHIALVAAASFLIGASPGIVPTASAQTPAANATTKGNPSYSPRLDELTKRLQGIQDRLKTASERIQRLRNYMVKNVNPNARLIVKFEDRMGAAFDPVTVKVYLDGLEVASWSKAKGTIRQGGKHMVLNKDVTAGARVVKVLANYKGAGGMPYMKDFAYKLNRSHKVQAKGGKITTLIVYGYQRGDATYDPSQRPWIGFDESAVEYSQTNARKLAPPPAPPSKPVTIKPAPSPARKRTLRGSQAVPTPLPVKAPEPTEPTKP